MEDKIRALVLQQYYTSPEVTAVSMFQYWTRLARYNPDLLMMLSFPRSREKERIGRFFFYEYSDDDVKKVEEKIGIENVRFVRTSLAREYFDAEQVQPLNEDEWEFLLFKNLERHAFDVVLSGRYGIAPFGRLLQFKRRSQVSSAWRLPWITFLTETEIDEHLPSLATDEARLLICADMAVADSVWCITEMDMERMSAVARDYLSPAFASEVRRKMRHVRPLICEEEMRKIHDEAVEVRKRMLEDGKVVLFHAGSLERKKKVPFVLELVKKWREKGCLGNVEALIAYTSEHSLSEVSRFRELPWVRLVKGVPREQYLEYLKEAHVGFFLPQYEGTGLTYLEMAASGMLMVYSYEMYKEKAPPKYPYVCRNDEELKDLIYVVSDAETVKKEMDGWIPRLMEFVYEKFGRKEAERTFGLVREVVNKNAETFDEKAIILHDVVREVLEGIDGAVKEDEAFGMIGGRTKVNMDGKRVKNLVTRIGLRLMARKLGFRDVGTFDEVVYSR